MLTSSSFFNFKQRLLLNSNQIDMSGINLKISRLDDYFDYDFKLEATLNSWNNPNSSLIKSDSLDSDFVGFCSNYKITNIKYNNNNKLIDLLNNIYLYDVFKTIVFLSYPLYSCIKLKENSYLFNRIEEYLIAECLEEIADVFHLPELTNVQLTALFLMSLCLSPDRHTDYKNFIRSWHIHKGIPIPYFIISVPYEKEDAVQMFTFFVFWVEFFYNNDKITLKKCTNIKMCAQTLIGDYSVNINRIDDTFYFSKNEDKPHIKIFKFGFETEYYYFIYYKCNRNFILQFTNSSEFSQPYRVDSMPYQNTIRVPKNKNDEKLIINISTDKSFKGFVQLDQTSVDICLNETNNFSKNIYVELELKKRMSQPIIFMDGNLIEDFSPITNRIQNENFQFKINQDIPNCNFNFSQYNGFQYYRVWHQQKLTLFISNDRFKFQNFFKFFNYDHNPIEIEPMSDCKTSLFLSGRIVDLHALETSRIAFFNSIGEVINHKSPALSDDTHSEVISECEQGTSVQIKNLIVNNQKLKNNIEAYWICLTLGKKLNKAFMNMPNFDIIDQPSLNEFIDDSTNTLSNILATNINLTSNHQSLILENLFYISLNTRLTLEVNLDPCSIRPKLGGISRFSVEGKLLDVDYLVGTCGIYLTSLSTTTDPFMRLVQKSSIIDSKFNSLSLIINNVDQHSITIDLNHFKLPFEIKDLCFFVKLNFKKLDEMYCLFCFHVPIMILE